MGIGNFERYTESGRGYNPTISINKSGVIGVNRGCVNRFELERAPYVILYYDKAGQRVGIQPTRDESEKGARKFRWRTDYGAEISARSFLDYYGIDRSQTRRYEVEWDSANKMMIINVEVKQEQQDLL